MLFTLLAEITFIGLLKGRGVYEARTSQFNLGMRAHKVLFRDNITQKNRLVTEAVFGVQVNYFAIRNFNVPSSPFTVDCR